MGIIVDHFVDPPCGGQRPVNLGQPCNYRCIHSLWLTELNQQSAPRSVLRMCVCVSRAPDEDDGGVFAGVQDSQEVCTTSFSTSPPSQVMTQPRCSILPVSLFNHVISSSASVLFISHFFLSLSPSSSLPFCEFACGASVCVHTEPLAL